MAWSERNKKQKNKGADDLGSDDEDAVVVDISSESDEEEEEIDPAEQEAERQQILLDYSEYLGLNIYQHHTLLYIAAEALACPLPDGWKEYPDGDENIFYFEKDEEATEEGEELTGTSTYAHPVEEVYRAQIEKSIKALEGWEVDELEFLKEQTIQIAISLAEHEPEEEPSARELFEEIDDDQNGFLDKLEVAVLCAKLGSALPVDVLEAAMDEMDRAGNNEVTFEEFDVWWSEKTATERRHRQLKDAFDVVDDRGTGCATKVQIQKILRRLGDDLATRELTNSFTAIIALQKEMLRERVQRAFDLVDLAGTGTIAKNKVTSVCMKLQATDTVMANAKLLGGTASEAKGREQISFGEVVDWWDNQYVQERMRKQVHEAFERVDEDGGGSLDKQEVRLFFSRLGDKVGSRGVDAAFAEMMEIEATVRAQRVINAFQTAADDADSLNEEQVGAAIEHLEDCLRGEEFENAYSQMVHNAAGHVTQEAFIEWYDKEDYGEWEDDTELRETFDRVDVDGGGTIDIEELSEVAEDLGSSALTSIFGQKKLEAAFEAMAPSEEGEVSFENFRLWWLKSQKDDEEPEISFDAFEIWYWDRITAEQVADEMRVKVLFNKIDVDGGGSLDQKEVAALAAELGEKLTGFGKSSADLDEAFAEMDPDGDEEVSLEEFRVWWVQKKEPPVVEYKPFEAWYWKRMEDEKEREEKHIRTLFEKIDADGGGSLDRKEVAMLSKELGDNLASAFSKKKSAEAFAEMDPDGDGEVTFDEFRNWWFRKLNVQRKKEEETRDLQFKKDAFWARRGRGQQQRTTDSDSLHNSTNDSLQLSQSVCCVSC